MYLQNKYTKWYENIIAKAKDNVNQIGYTEKHHIIPKSLGGTNDPSNLIKLTPKEHYICHLLLTKMVEDSNRRKMWYAHYMMMRGINRYRPTARMYDLAKRNLAKANMDRPGPNNGRKMPGVSEANKLKKGIKLPPRTADHSAKLSVLRSDETKRKMSEARIGKSWGYTHSEETKAKMSAKSKGRIQPTKTCEHCKKTVAIGNYNRWHGANCKLLIPSSNQ